MINLEPIGRLSCLADEKYKAARQSGLQRDVEGVIRLFPGFQYEQALQDLEGFDRIWVLFLFDRNENWKPKVMPPRGGKKRGVFATRSPHRPNPIGLSCVPLLGIKDLEIKIGSHDMLNDTLILDIKPYLPYADAFSHAKCGWVDEIEKESLFQVLFSKVATKQLEFIKMHGGPDLEKETACTLQISPVPHPSRRIKSLDENRFELGYKTWRLHFSLQKSDRTVTVHKIVSGYSNEDLNSPHDRWGDKILHQKFREQAPQA